MDSCSVLTTQGMNYVAGTGVTAVGTQSSTQALSCFDSLLSASLSCSDVSTSVSCGAPGLSSGSVQEFMSGGVATACGDFESSLLGLTPPMPDAAGVVKLFEGLGEDASVEDFTTAWMRAQYPDMSDAEIAAVNSQYSGNTAEMLDYYKGLEAEYSDLLTETEGQEVNVEDYYRSFLQKSYPDMSEAEISNLCSQYKGEYDKLVSQFEAIGEEYNIDENQEMSLNEYFTNFLRKSYPDMSDEEIASMAANYEKNSQPYVEYYNELASLVDEGEGEGEG